jgi:N-[(2S)-2-amino-2-carboxyethyl]-L-glutamate dehydrogenase
MRADDILILGGGDILSLLAGREAELVELTRRAYEAHAAGDSSLPHSSFLRFPANARDRIIALPAYLGGEFGVAGIKWVSSFPGNLERGIDRASAALILNSTQTGRPQAIMEGSVISAKRTAASAALAARLLQPASPRATRAGFVGCGLINFEVARFVLAACPELTELAVFDIDRARAESFAAKCREAFAEVTVSVARELDAVFASCPLVSLATTAIEPHVRSLSACTPDSTVLHVSLRDLSPEAILACDNVVDDIDHVCREKTSVHLAEQLSGSRAFVRGTLADVSLGRVTPRGGEGRPVVFSPFGLGVLDIAFGKFVRELAIRQRRGTVIDSFLPEPWQGRNS